MTDMLLTVLAYALVGFLAQLVDGAIGMAYGVVSTSLLLLQGVSPATASASVKMAEVVTTGVSGASHHLLGNVNRKLVLQLLIPGVLGGVLGAYVLSSLDGARLKPYISGYLIVMGAVIIFKAFRTIRERQVDLRATIPLGLFGGFFDAVGGGGWGPIVTTNLVALGNCPRRTVGSVNAAEFFVTLAQVFTFVVLLRMVMWPVSLGLLIGGVAAAPLAALACQRLPRRATMVLVGALIIIVSALNVYKALHG